MMERMYVMKSRTQLLTLSVFYHQLKKTDFPEVIINIGRLVLSLIGNFLAPESSVPLACQRHNYSANFPRR